MVTKRFWVVVLAGLNLALLAFLLLGRTWLPSAFAQGGGRGGGFVCVTAKAAGQSYDVLYVLDGADRKLHAFFAPNTQTRELTYGGFRDLKADFGQNQP